MRHFILHLFIIVCAIINPKEIKALLTSELLGVIPTMHFDAIYQFGDSLSDTGNLVRERNGRDVNFARLPYGRTYFHRATGRCSDGLLMVDFFAMFFHLPLLKPYLAKWSDFTYGANFAVAGATALDYPTLATINVSSAATYSSLSVQLRWFRSHLASICYNPRDCRRRVQRSLVIMGEIGGNDYNAAFFNGRTMADVYSLVPQVVQAIKYAVEEMIKLGAKNIVVPGNFPIGCIPLYLVQFKTYDFSKYDELHCLKEYNEFSQYHNQRLNEALQELQYKYPSVAIAYADYYSALTWLLRHAPSLGFEEDGLETACCAEAHNPYNYGPARPCGSPGVPVCPDPTKVVNWDGIHMTQQANKYVAIWLLRHFVPKLLQRRIRIRT